MPYEDLIELPLSQFKRACGVDRRTFAVMLDVLTPHLDRCGQRGGQNALGVADQLLLTLQYWREYRTIPYRFRLSNILLVLSGQRLSGNCRAADYYAPPQAAASALAERR